MNFIGVSSRNYHDGDTKIDGSLTITSGEINIPKYDTDIKALQDKTQFQNITDSNIIEETVITKPTTTLNSIQTNIALGINFTTKFDDIYLKDVLVDEQYLYVPGVGSNHYRTVILYRYDDEKDLHEEIYDYNVNNNVLNFNIKLEKNTKYTVAINSHSFDFYKENPIFNSEFVIFNGLSESANQPYVYLFPNIASTKYSGLNLVLERHYDNSIVMSRDLYLENDEFITKHTNLYPTEYTGTLVNMTDKRTWGFGFTVLKSNMRLRHLTVRGDLLNTSAIMYYPTRNFHIYVQNDPNVNNFTLLKTVVMELKNITASQYQRIDLDCDLEQGKRYKVAVDLLYEPNPNVANAYLTDKVGNQAPPVEDDYFANIIDLPSYSFHTPNYGIPLQQTFPITLFYLFNIEFEETNILQQSRTDLYLNAITSNSKYHIFDNPNLTLSYGDLVCIRQTQGFSIEKTDVNNSYTKPIGIFIEHLDDNKCKVLIKGEGYCNITGGCVAGDEFGLSTTDLGKCERNGTNLFAISMEEVISGDADMVKLYLY